MNTPPHSSTEDRVEKLSINEQHVPKQYSINALLDSGVLRPQPQSENIEAMDADSDSDYEDDEEISGETKTENKIEEIQNNNMLMEVTSVPERSSSGSNIKLVLKKSPGFEISKHPLIHQTTTKPQTNKVFVVTLVTNASTRPVYAATTYSKAGPKTNVHQTILTKVLDSTISPISSISTESSPQGDTIKLAMGHQMIKGTSNERQEHENFIENSCKIDGRKTTLELIATNREEIDDNESIQSETSELKTSTPKIKRELKQLQKTVTESKILTEYMSESVYSKGRKSRKAPLKTGSDFEYSPLSTITRRSRSRSCSKPRLDSPLDGSNLSKWPSEERLNKRQNMRSQNTEFMQKHMKFLNRIHGDGDLSDNSDGENSVSDNKPSPAESQIQIIKRSWQPPPKPGWDSFCWKCHTTADLIPCSKCIKSYHLKCLRKHAPAKADNSWICPECVAVDNSMKGLTRTWKGSPLSVEQLCHLLQFSLKRMKQFKGYEVFCGKIDDEENNDYYKYIANPVTLDILQKKIENKAYKCAEEFAVEAKWIHHNTMVYFGNSGKLPNIAKNILKICRQEVTEIDTCPECYYNANTSKDWFVEVCSRPHILLWAKLKGFPYWPAKAMGVNSGALVNVRFFGDYDRAYVPVKECFLYSEKDPNPPTKQNKRNNMAGCIKEVDIHIKKIIAKFGSFKFAPFKSPYYPSKDLEQLEQMIPGVTEHIKKAQASPKPTLTYKIVKSADNHLSIIKKPDLNGSGGDNSSNDSKHINYSTIPDRGGKDSIKIVERKSSDNSECGSFDLSPTKSGGVVGGSSCGGGGGDGGIKTYEVITKKDESDDCKVSSVILKRKSDNWNTVSPSSSKKQKNFEGDSSRGEQTVSSSSDSGYIQTDSEKTVLDLKEDVLVYKRKRSEDNCSPKAQRPKSDDENSQQPVKVLTTDQNVPNNLIIAPQVTSSVASSVASSSSSSLPVVNSLNNEDDLASSSNNNKTNLSEEKNDTTDNTEVLPVDKNDDDKNDDNKNREERVQGNADSKSQRENNVTQNDNSVSQGSGDSNQEKEVENDGQMLNKESESLIPPPVVKQSHPPPDPPTAKTCDLIPFVEIKTEKPDSDEDRQKSLAAVQSVESCSKNATVEQQESLQNVLSVSNESATQQQNSVGDVEKVAVKTEISSEDEENVQTLKTVESSSNVCNVESSEASKSIEQPIQRITVRDIATLRVQPINNKKAQVQDKKKTIGVMKVEVKKQNQRARKSFPNKSSFPPTSSSSSGINTCPPKRPGVAPITYQNSKNINNMVYIPVDSKGQTSIQKVIPIPPLTAVSKATVAQTSVTTTTTSSSLTTLATKTSQIAITIPTSGGQIDLIQQQTVQQQQQPTTQQAFTVMPMAVQETPPPTISPTTTLSTLNTTQSNMPNNSVETDHMLSGFVTPNLAAAITDTIVRGPPKLSPKPSRALGSEGDSVFPTKAGPACKFLMENSHKISDFFRSVIEDTLADMAGSGIIEAKNKLMEIEMEKTKHSYEKQLEELKHNTDLMLCEMRNSWEKEKATLVAETRKQCEMERIRAIEECKKKQWCANCGKEAQFYCCWNTSYCDYPCQQKHWTRHMNSCAQNDNPDANAQKIGVKITNVKDKKMKSNEMPIPRMPGNNFIRTTMPVPRNPVPVQRLVSIPIPISTNSAPPRYTLLNREGNWELMPSPNFQRVMPSTGVIMTDSNGKATVGTSSQTLVRANNQM